MERLLTGTSRRGTGALGAALLAAMIALGVGACDARSDYYDGYGSSSSCAAYTSCQTCTPVLGCGWCMNGNGTGTCAPGPDYCTGQQFSWTWEPTGCHVPADASTSSDAGTDAKSEAASDAANEANEAGGDAPHEATTDAPAND